MRLFPLSFERTDNSGALNAVIFTCLRRWILCYQEGLAVALAFEVIGASESS